MKQLYCIAYALFNCPCCRKGIVGYYYLDKKKQFHHWGQCDNWTCEKQYELKLVEEAPDDPFELIVVNEPGA
ncbi:hypothetical protein D3H55_22795 [Bacillus salacetis]|uniref:Uncharacterized protein n=1 Tax=Bacillus salacetis TaxID=2315464 RepID=A0A3A1QM66_9BACI|nr:hypothetical protein [Bacillus salacetis]RIW27620.1 hypothetical protein D3H55_22795 [Bacillus salacetis]